MMLLVLWRIKEYLIISSIMYKCTIIKQSVIWEIIIPTSAVGRNVFNHFQWYHSTEVFDNYIINQLWTINACKQNLQVWGLLSAKSIWIIPSCSSMFCKFFFDFMKEHAEACECDIRNYSTVLMTTEGW